MIRYVNMLKNDICQNIIIFFLYLSEFILWDIKYVKYIAILVPINVTIENIRGKKALVFSHTHAEASWKFHAKSTISQRAKVKIIIIILQTSHAIKLHNEWIHTSDIVTLFGPKDIFW